MRLAWFTPLPPVASGVARYNLELLPGLTSVHQIDLYVDVAPSRFTGPPGASIFNAHDFVWKHDRTPYDLIVYQLGNAPCHDYMWAYIVRYPGLVVLHDGQLHHARGRHLLLQKREDDYRSEFRFNEPESNPDLAELGIAGLLGSLTYLWAMRRIVVEASRHVIVHNHWLADQIRTESPASRVSVVEMGVPSASASVEDGEAIRIRHGIPADAIVFTALGAVTPEKRVPQAIRALASLLPSIPNLHLLLVGGPVDHYDARAEAEALGVSTHVTVTGYVPHDDISAYLAASDVCLCMRWPSSRETSAAWLRCLAAGRATIVTDLVHTVDIPALDPRNWSLLYASHDVSQEGEPAPRPEPAVVSIDILDEDHSLRLAMRKLATDAKLRAALGRNGRELWAERFSLERMVSSYQKAIDEAAAAEAPSDVVRTAFPSHFLTDGSERAVRVLREIGLPESRIAGLWQSDSPSTAA